jgi:hypothetical protein
VAEGDRRLDEVAPKLKTSVRMLSETVRADAREGDSGAQLDEIAKANPKVVIGSYPFFDQQHGPNTNVVLRARDAQKLALAKRAVEDMAGAGAGGTIEERLMGYYGGSVDLGSSTRKSKPRCTTPSTAC